MNRYFFGQTAVYDSGQYRTEPSCKKAKKSLEPFLRKTANQLTNQLLTNYYQSDLMGPGDYCPRSKIQFFVKKNHLSQKNEDIDKLE